MPQVSKGPVLLSHRKPNISPLHLPVPNRRQQPECPLINLWQSSSFLNKVEHQSIIDNSWWNRSSSRVPTLPLPSSPLHWPSLWYLTPDKMSQCGVQLSSLHLTRCCAQKMPQKTSWSSGVSLCGGGGEKNRKTRVNVWDPELSKIWKMC